MLAIGLPELKSLAGYKEKNSEEIKKFIGNSSEEMPLLSELLALFSDKTAQTNGSLANKQEENKSTCPMQ